MENKLHMLSAVGSLPTVVDIDDGYALFENDSLRLVFANPALRNWFGLDALHATVDAILQGLDKDRLVNRLGKRGYYQFSYEPAVANRQVPLSLECTFRRTLLEGNLYISLYARDMSIVKEKDAQILSNAKLIEHNNRELARLTRRLEAENQRLGSELEVTRKLQQMLLPHQSELQNIAGLDIACFMEPADEVGGDYYDVLQYGDRVRIGIGDVTGHGLHSSVVMMMVQTAVRTLLASDETDSRRLLGILNNVIYSNVERMQADKNLTLMLLDYQNGQVKICGQHEEVLVVRKGGLIERLDTTNLGFPIGLDQNIGDFIAEVSVDLTPGDGLVLYTDGVTEAENPQGEHYRIERLCSVISRYWAADAETIKREIVDDLRQHIGTQKVFDDITLIVLKQL